MRQLIWMAMTFFLSAALQGQEAGWENLFNGKDLSGWKKLNGNAVYQVEDGTISGISTPNTPNTFLATERSYRDFILELEVRIDPLLNSGIQFRSESRADYQNGRVHGYQAEIDPSARAYSGGIYDEARREWLYPLSLNPMGQSAFRNGQWNHYHIEAIGPDLRIWVNGINTANLADDKTAEGIIALQVHSISDPALAGRKVQWRNIRIRTKDLAAARRVPHPAVPEENLLPNTLSDYEKRHGWRLLWDGQTTRGWRGGNSESFPEKGWEIRDGILSVLETGGGESAGSGDIITTDRFSNFELKVEFRLTPGANSGIKYLVDPELNKGPGSEIGLEFQLLDDKLHPDAKEGVAGNRTIGSLYDLIPAANLSVPGDSKRVRPPGEWNQARIVATGNHVEHWLNGFKVMEYERNTPMFRALVAYSKYKIWPGFGAGSEGHILLQEHGNPVSFRSIKIREL